MTSTESKPPSPPRFVRLPGVTWRPTIFCRFRCGTVGQGDKDPSFPFGYERRQKLARPASDSDRPLAPVAAGEFSDIVEKNA